MFGQRLKRLEEMSLVQCQSDCEREGTRMGWRRPTVEGLKGLAKNEHSVLNVKVKGDARLKMTFLQRLES